MSVVDDTPSEASAAMETAIVETGEPVVAAAAGEEGGVMRIGKRCYVSNLAWKTSWQVCVRSAAPCACGGVREAPWTPPGNASWGSPWPGAACSPLFRSAALKHHRRISRTSSASAATSSTPT